MTIPASLWITLAGVVLLWLHAAARRKCVVCHRPWAAFTVTGKIGHSVAVCWRHLQTHRRLERSRR